MTFKSFGDAAHNLEMKLLQVADSVLLEEPLEPPSRQISCQSQRQHVRGSLTSAGKVGSAAGHLDKEAFMNAVRRNAAVLQHAPAEVRADREIVLAAVARDGRALEFASESLRGDHDVVMAAVQQHGLALQFASGDLCG